MDSEAQAKKDARDIVHPAPLPGNLPPRPPKPARAPSEDDERASPPRKRPRTQAVRRAAPAPPTPSNIPPALSPSTSTKDWAPQASISRFPIQPISRFRGASASIKRPQEVAHFSYDDNHNYVADDSGINYYCPPPIGADLKAGFSSFRHYEDTSNPHLDSLLRALADAERATGTAIPADLVTWRGMMTKILTAPYDNFAEFSMFATLHTGTIYLEEDFPSRAAQRAQESSRPPQRHQDPSLPDHKMMTYWGYKFETLALLPTPTDETPQSVIDGRPNAPVSNYAQHCSIVRTSFGLHTLLLGGEVDGLSGPKPTSPTQPIPWLELKTSEQLPPRPSHRDLLKFERKLLKFWAQSFLLGVPRVVIGWRSKMGILTGVQELETAGIPGMVRRGTGCWDGNVCINFAAGFLGWLRGVVGEEGKVYRVRLGRREGVVEVVRVEGEGEGEGIVSGEWRAWREELGRRGKGEEKKGEEKETGKETEKESA